MRVIQMTKITQPTPLNDDQARTSTLTLSGRKFSKKELIGIQQTIKTFPNLSLTELA